MGTAGDIERDCNTHEIRIHMRRRKVRAELQKIQTVVNILPDLLNIIEEYAASSSLWKWNRQPNINDQLNKHQLVKVSTMESLWLATHNKATHNKAKHAPEASKAIPESAKRAEWMSTESSWMTLEELQAQTRLTPANPSSLCICSQRGNCLLHVNNVMLSFMVAIGVMTYKYEL